MRSDPPPRVLMLVSERADRRLRESVAQGRRPCPEYLLLEERYGVELLDWSRLAGGGCGRGLRLSVRHALAAARRLADYDVVLSDGEHLGIPLALAMRALRISTPHLMIGHHLTTAVKRRLSWALRSDTGVRRILVHSGRQLDLAVTDLGLPASKVALIPYSADTSFWVPRAGGEEELIVAAGREHRDYVTLARACRQVPAQVRIAAGSLHSPGAHQTRPDTWSPNVSWGFADHLTLRDLYARARVVVVPLVETDFQAGVTTLLEAMAMGKPVVVTATAGQRDVVVDGETAVMVRPGDADALRDVVMRLLADPVERARLGAAAREAVERRFTVEAHAQRIASHLLELAGAPCGTTRRSSGCEAGHGTTSPSVQDSPAAPPQAPIRV